MTAFEIIVGRSADADSSRCFPFDGKEMTSRLPIVKAAFRPAVKTYLATRLRDALARDSDLPIDISLDRRHAVALLDLDR